MNFLEKSPLDREAKPPSPRRRPSEPVADFGWVEIAPTTDEINYLDTFLKAAPGATIDYRRLDIPKSDPSPSKDSKYGFDIASMQTRLAKWGKLSVGGKKQKNKELNYDLDDSFIDDHEGTFEVAPNAGCIESQFEDFVCVKGNLKDFKSSKYYLDRVQSIKTSILQDVAENKKKKVVVKDKKENKENKDSNKDTNKESTKEKKEKKSEDKEKKKKKSEDKDKKKESRSVEKEKNKEKKQSKSAEKKQENLEKEAPEKKDNKEVKDKKEEKETKESKESAGIENKEKKESQEKKEKKKSTDPAKNKFADLVVFEKKKPVKRKVSPNEEQDGDKLGAELKQVKLNSASATASSGEKQTLHLKSPVS